MTDKQRDRMACMLALVIGESMKLGLTERQIAAVFSRNNIKAGVKILEAHAPR